MVFMFFTREKRHFCLEASQEHGGNQPRGSANSVNMTKHEQQKATFYYRKCGVKIGWLAIFAPILRKK